MLTFGAELDTPMSLGKVAGIGVTVSNLAGQDRHINDATPNMLPIRPKRVYAVTDSIIKLKPKKRRLDIMGPISRSPGDSNMRRSRRRDMKHRSRSGGRSDLSFGCHAHTAADIGRRRKE